MAAKGAAPVPPRRARWHSQHDILFDICNLVIVNYLRIELHDEMVCVRFHNIQRQPERHEVESKIMEATNIVESSNTCHSFFRRYGGLNKMNLYPNRKL